MIYLVDIDGTLADLTHRLHHIQKEPADWDGFFAACEKDEPIPEVINIVQALDDADYFIILVSGRSSTIKKSTLQWLELHDVPFDAIYMRKAGDKRHDDIVKAELLEQIMDDWREKLPILGVFEDRKQVVDMYRAKGLRVFQVADGNF